MSNKNWRFETKQLHVGQEQADPVTDSRAVQVTSTADLQTLQKIFLNRE